MAKKRLIINGEPFEYDMNDKEDASLYEQNKKVKGAFDPDEAAKPKSSTEDEGFFSLKEQGRRLKGAIIPGVVGGLTGGVPGAAIGAASGYASPAEDLVDLGIGVAGGPIAGKASSTVKGLMKNAGKASNFFGQMMTGGAYGAAENAVSKALKNPQEAMKNPSSLAPNSPQEFLSIAMQGLLPAGVSNMGSTPSAISTRKYPGASIEGTDPSKLAQNLTKGKDALKAVDQAVDSEGKFVLEMGEEIEKYSKRQQTASERNLKLKDKVRRNLDDVEIERNKNKSIISQKQFDIKTQERTIEDEIEFFNETKSAIEDSYSKGITTSADYAQQSKQLLDDIKLRKTQLKDLEIQKAQTLVETVQNNQVPLDVLRQNSRIADIVAKNEGQKLRLNRAIDDTKRQINMGTFQDAELSKIFKNSKSTEEIIDSVFSSSPSTMKNFFSHYEKKGLGTDMKEAFLQRMAMESYDPQTNSFGNGITYITDKIKGNATEKLSNIFGDVHKADKFIQDFKEINDAMKLIKNNQLKSSLLANLGTAAAFVISGHNPVVATKVLAGEAASLVWLKWGTLLNKMASSPKFNSAFKDWMKDGASAEVLKKSDYLLSQLRESGYEQPFD